MSGAELHPPTARGATTPPTHYRIEGGQAWMLWWPYDSPFDPWGYRPVPPAPRSLRSVS